MTLLLFHDEKIALRMEMASFFVLQEGIYHKKDTMYSLTFFLDKAKKKRQKEIYL